MTLPDDYTPPPRSLLYAKPVPADQGGGVLLGCDCGTTTHLVVDGLEQLTKPQELAVTCDGCNSTTWITAGPVDQLEQLKQEKTRG